MQRSTVAALGLVILTLGAGPVSTVRVDDWAAQPPGPLNLSAAWHRYPPGATSFSRPPTVVTDGGRRVLELATTSEAMRIGRDLTDQLAQPGEDGRGRAGAGEDSDPQVGFDVVAGIFHQREIGQRPSPRPL